MCTGAVAKEQPLRIAREHPCLELRAVSTRADISKGDHI